MVPRGPRYPQCIDAGPGDTVTPCAWCGDTPRTGMVMSKAEGTACRYRSGGRADPRSTESPMPWSARPASNPAARRRGHSTSIRTARTQRHGVCPGGIGPGSRRGQPHGHSFRGCAYWCERSSARGWALMPRHYTPKAWSPLRLVGATLGHGRCIAMRRREGSSRMHTGALVKKPLHT